jgi:hypothetical protein
MMTTIKGTSTVSYRPLDAGVEVIFTAEDGMSSTTVQFTPGLWRSFRSTIEKLMPDEVDSAVPGDT